MELLSLEVKYNLLNKNNKRIGLNKSQNYFKINLLFILFYDLFVVLLQYKK